MKKDFTSFLIRLLIYSILIYAGFLLLKNSIPAKFNYAHVEYLLLFFFVVTAAFHLGMLRSAAQGGKNIVTYFMMASAFKFLLYLLVMVAYALLNPGSATAFISNFFVIYMLLAVFEAAVLYSRFKGKPVDKTIS